MLQNFSDSFMCAMGRKKVKITDLSTDKVEKGGTGYTSALDLREIIFQMSTRRFVQHVQSYCVLPSVLVGFQTPANRRKMFRRTERWN